MKPNRSRGPVLAAITLALACWSAQAATVDYTGLVDSGPLAGSTFDGRFSFADPAAGFDGSVAVDGFTLRFNGQTHTLASADAPVLAWFGAGNFLGIDFVDLDLLGTTVQLTAGFTDLSEASFSYQQPGAVQGLGGFTSFTAVAAPSPLALLLGAGLCLAATRRRPTPKTP